MGPPALETATLRLASSPATYLHLFVWRKTLATLATKRQTVYRVNLDLVVMFGLMEVQAQIAVRVSISIEG